MPTLRWRTPTPPGRRRQMTPRTSRWEIPPGNRTPGRARPTTSWPAISASPPPAGRPDLDLRTAESVPAVDGKRHAGDRPGRIAAQIGDHRRDLARRDCLCDQLFRKRLRFAGVSMMAGTTALT